MADDFQVVERAGKIYWFPRDLPRIEAENRADELYRQDRLRAAGLADRDRRLPPRTPDTEEGPDPEALRDWMREEELRPGNAARSALAGASFNWGDELLAAIRSMGTETFDEALKDERTRMKRYRERNPGEAFAAELAGGVLPSVAAIPFTGGASAVPVAGRAAAMMAPAGSRAVTKSLGDQLWKNAGIGLTAGTVAEVGAGEGLEDRLSRIPEGASTGFALGASVPVALQGVGAGLSRLKQAYAPSQRDQALARIMKEMERDGLTPDDLSQIARQDKALDVPTTIFDYSPNLTTRGEVIVNQPGEGGARMAQHLIDRNRGSRDRMMDRIRRDVSGGDFYQEEANRARQMSSKARRLYEQAGVYVEGDGPRVQISSPELTELFQRPAAKASLPGAIKMMENKGLKPGVVLDDDGRLVSLDTQTAFYMKKAMDDAETNAKATVYGQPKGTHDSGAIGDVGHAWQREIRKLNPAYDRAATEYAGDVAVVNALRTGRHEFMGMHPEEIKKFINDPSTSAAEKQAFRTGVAQQLSDMIYKLRANQSVTDKFDPTFMRDRLEPLFDDPSAFRLFLAAIDRDALTKVNANKAIANSATYRRAAAADDDQVDLIGAMFSSNRDLLRTVMRFLDDKTHRSEARRNEMASILMQGTPSEVASVVREMKQLSSRRRMMLDRRRQARPAQTLAVMAPVQEDLPPQEGDDPDRNYAEGGAVWDGRPEGTLWQRYLSHGR